MSSRSRKKELILEIDAAANQYVGKTLDMEKFLKEFDKNGSGGTEFVHYEDIVNFIGAYEAEDPRKIDFPDSDIKDEDFPYPDISIFINITKDSEGNFIIGELSICKVYSNGCYSSGINSYTLINAEAERINELISSVISNASKINKK